MPGVGRIATSRRDHSLTAPFFFLPVLPPAFGAAHRHRTRFVVRRVARYDRNAAVRSRVLRRANSETASGLSTAPMTNVCLKTDFSFTLCEKRENARGIHLLTRVDRLLAFFSEFTQFAPKFTFSAYLREIQLAISYILQLSL